MKKNKFSAFSLIEISIVILVIGILIAGVASGSRLIKDSRLKTARSISQSSIVSGLDGLVYWLDATAENIYTNSSNSNKISDGERVKTIRDNNPGTNLTFSEASSGIGPKYITNGINGLPSLYFNGSGDCLSAPNSFKLDPINFTFFIVTKSTGDQAVNGTIVTLYNNVNSGSSGGFRFFQYTTGTPAISYWTLRFPPSWPGSNGSANQITRNAPTILTVTHSEQPVTSAPTTKLYQKGNLVFNDTSALHLVNSNMSTTDYIYLGCRMSGSLEQFYNGHISEIILYNQELTASDRTEVEKYLMKKYNIRN
jgi:type II secretory pathway pseudopilin PulG